jgi:hypothetical protein
MIADLVSCVFGTIWNEEIADGREQRNEALQAAYRSKPLSHSFPLSKRYMGVLNPIVQAFVRAMLDIGHDLTLRCCIRAQFVSHYPLWHHALFLQKPRQQTPGRLGIPAVLHDFIKDIAILIDSATASTSCL